MLLDLEVESINPVAKSTEADGGKGLGTVIGWLAVQVGTLESLRSVIAAVVGWATRTGHTVQVNYGGDQLVVKGVTSAQQERIIDSFLARHATGT